MDGVPAGAQKSRTYYVHPTHGVRRLPMRWETFGPVLTTPNPAAVRAREWLREFKYWQEIAEMNVPRSAFKAFLKELVRG